MDNTTGVLPINTENDIVACRKCIRDISTEIGFGITDVTRIVTSVSELARNVYVHAKSGEMHWQTLQQFGKIGIELIFKDRGDGIQDIEQAMRPGFSTANSMGMGLPGVKRLMDQIDISSTVGVGTTIKIQKWAKAR